MTVTMNNKVAIYCRVSTHLQKEEKTIETQREGLTSYAERQGWEIYDTYVDEGISGAYMESREDFLRLLADMKSRKFDILLVSEQSRISRTENPEERGRILRLLKENGIKLASPHEGILAGPFAIHRGADDHP